MSTHQHPARTLPSVPASATPAVELPLKNWAFPFTPVDSKADATDPMTYMKALASVEDGFYPLGTSGMWHGGVHFDENSAQMLKQDDGVRAIADGEVVAYSIDGKYQEQVYKDGRRALYSTGFVLIRHKLQLPPVPPKPAASSPQGAQGQAASTQHGAANHPASSTPGASASAPEVKSSPDETLTFFSLYMHLMDWNSYQTAQRQTGGTQGDQGKKANIAPMSYWEGDRYYRVGDKAPDAQDAPKPKAAPSAPAGTSFDLLGEFIDAGFTVRQPLPPAQSAEDTPLVTPVKGIRIREQPNGKIIGILPKGGEVTVSDADPKYPGWAKIKAIRSGQLVGPVAGQSALGHAQWGWVYVKELEPVVDPKPLDTVVVLKEPYKVNAGDVVGQLGHYLRYVDAKLLPAQPTRSLLHLEVFAGPELKAFIQKSQARARKIFPPRRRFWKYRRAPYSSRTSLSQRRRCPAV